MKSGLFERNRMRYFILIQLLVLFLMNISQSSRAEGSVKIGYIDATQIFEITKLGKRSKVTLEDYIRVRQQVVNQDEYEINSLEEEIKKQGPSLSQDSKKEKEMLFQKKVSLFQKRAADLNKEIQEKRTEVFREFHKILEAVVKTVAEKEGYEVVLDKNPDIGTVFYISSTMDISNKVIEQMDKQNP